MGLRLCLVAVGAIVILMCSSAESRMILHSGVLFLKQVGFVFSYFRLHHQS